MGDGLRTIRLLTNDESLIASARAAVASLEGWEVDTLASQNEVEERPPVAGDVLLLDSWVRGRNVYEFCRYLTGHTRCRTFVVVEHDNEWADSIARFSGATGVLHRPLTASALRDALDVLTPPAPLPSEGRQNGLAHFDLPEALLTDIKSGEPSHSLIRALIDPETGLFNYAFLNYKLDEEFKRAHRFEHPLTCVMLGFEGNADESVLRELAAIFLDSSRDTDVLGRFDESSFLFLLPNTGPDGARVMADRVAELAEERGLSDLVGDSLVISVGISSYPHPDLAERQDLYVAARDAFMDARHAGGGVVTAS